MAEGTTDKKTSFATCLGGLYLPLKSKSMHDFISTGYIRECGKTLVDSEGDINNTVTYVQSLLDLKERFDQFLKNSFGTDHTFKQAICSVCERLNY